ncbi:NIF domain-containing protein [Cordyceps javanica]|uniref:Mitochondrial import inner membrane translocase subunit TIM50 n=1 Tax=Cordyceps javanica TaxID=43265 RepID=A0A545WBD1_9HYPO|nr:NIF domain-containing protein [Cordyceps javanica]TQW11262.1 NIF domain protein [Cordyceps javanica]
MTTQEVSAASQQMAHIPGASIALVKKAAKAPPWRHRKNKAAATATVTGSGEKVQVTVTKPKIKTQKPKNQKKADREDPEAAAAATTGAEVSSPRQVVQVTETTESKVLAVSKVVERRPFIRDEITVPSAESGGVPEPTTAYLSCAQLAPSRLVRPRRILIVMDLNGTLLHRPNKRRPSHFVTRPYARVFMDYLLTNFAVAVWSSARPENVHGLVASLLTPAQRQRCVVVWGRDRFGLSRADYDSRVQVYKRLARVWSDRAVMSAHPDARRGGRWDQSNTVLVDDSAEKARSEPHNLLQIPEYAGPVGELPFVLPQVHDYINELAYQADISRYIRENPFRLDAGYTL